MSLADIAARAGVSKGALTHHFPSRNALEAAIIEDSNDTFWAEVHSYIDAQDPRPGRLLRAYVHALTSQSVVMRELFSPTSIIVMLGLEQGAHALVERDALRWREAFAAEGIDHVTSRVIQSAAEGLAAAIDTPYLTPEELQGARARLLDMVENAASAPSH